MDAEDIDKLLAIDFAHDRDFLHLSPNENVVSNAAKKYVTQDLSNRYYFGPSSGNEQFMQFGSFTALGKNGIAALLAKTEQYINQATGSSNVLFAPLSGLHSMMISILNTSCAGQTIFCLHPKYGGHFATMGMIQAAGRVPKPIPMNRKTLDIDYEQLATVAKAEQGGYSVYIDASYSLIPFDISRLRAVIGSHRLVYDASHTMGLILGGQFPNPLAAGADIITANTHKTLPGSHKGMILFANGRLFEEVDGPAHALYSSTHIDHTITLCITLWEMALYGREYASNVIKNANLLGDALTAKGLLCRRADTKQWTYTHQLHLLTGTKEPIGMLAKRFFDNNLAVAFDNMFEQGPFVRLGVQEITRRGASQTDIEELAELLCAALAGQDVKAGVVILKKRLDRVHYSFDMH